MNHNSVVLIALLIAATSCGTKKSASNVETKLNEIILVNAVGERCEVAEMINLISTSKPKAIGINFLYIDERGERCDTMLSQAIRHSGKVILIEGFENGKHVTSNDKFVNAAMLSGTTGLEQDGDGVTDAYYRLIDHRGKWEYSFPFHLALQYDPTQDSKLVAMSFPEDYRIRFYHSINDFKVIEGLRQVHDNKDIFGGKIVLIGSMGQARDNIFKTPVTEKTSRETFGTVIIANVVLDILRDLDTKDEDVPLRKYTDFIMEQQKPEN